MDLTVFQNALNEAQLDAVTYCDGPLLVIAGAGSGKTRVLTYKIAYLLQNGFQPWNILALTFTNKAAKEMNSRISQLCGNMSVQGLWSGTFHSMFARLLRYESEAINYPSDFTIYDAADSKSLVKAIVKELQLDDKEYKANVVAGRISDAKSHLILPDAYAADKAVRDRDAYDNMPAIYKVYTVYQQRLRAAGAMDFDDILLNTFLLLRDHPDIRAKYIQRFRYILVDEYQDTNLVQYRILAQLTDETSRICVVGDDAQSIYGFRGADISNILNFRHLYGNARLVKLERNYRSTKTLVRAANSIISYNEKQIPKKVYSEGEQGEPITLFSAETDKEEARKITAYTMRLTGKGVPYDEIAVLYRTNAQSRVIEEALQHAGIPYRVYGGLSFYQRKEIKDVLAYFRLVCNPNDEEAFCRIINYPTRGIGATTLQRIRYAAAQSGVSLWQVICTPEACGLTVSKAVLNKLENFRSLIASFMEMARTERLSKVARAIVLQSGIAADLASERSAESISRQENIDELLGAVTTFEEDMAQNEDNREVTLAGYLSTVSLLTDVDTNDDGRPKVTLMTVHAAKGLEFEAVFVSGMEDNLFPGALARFSVKEKEEERRLFYVAVTRAKRYCFLSYAKSRFRYGSLQLSEPSEFLEEIDEECLKREEEKPLFAGRSGGQSSYRRGGSSGFDDFFGAPSEDDFRASMGGSNAAYRGDRYGDRSESYSGTTAVGYECKTYTPREDYIPKRVQPMAPPDGFKRSAIRPKEPAKTPVSASLTSQPVNGVKVGSRILHSRFGEGTVEALSGAGDNAQIVVNFKMAGTKKLLVKFAKFEIL